MVKIPVTNFVGVESNMSFLSKEILVTPFCSGFGWKHPLRPLSSLPLFPATICFRPTGKSVRPDLTNGKGTGKSPVLGINRGGPFVQHMLFGVPEPFCRSKEPCRDFSLSTCLTFWHWRPEPRVTVISNMHQGPLTSEWENESVFGCCWPPTPAFWSFPYMVRICAQRRSLRSILSAIRAWLR